MNFGGTIRINRFGLLIIACLLIILVYYNISSSSSSEQPQKVNLRQLLLAALEAAEKGGHEVVKGSHEPSAGAESKGETKEGVNIPVTKADYNSHCVMFYGIAKTFPFLKVISEEGENEKGCKNLTPLELNSNVPNLPDEEVLASDVAIWIDPLDATKEYTERLFEYVTTMVCVSYQGKPIIGVIHKPFGSEPKTTWAWLNQAMSKNLQSINDNTGITSKNVLVSMSHAGKAHDLIEPIFGKDAKLVPAAGSGYKTLEVTAGNATAYIHASYISKWDICAGDAILTATGNDLKISNSKIVEIVIDRIFWKLKFLAV
ncbi:unnamed protein product [Nesidiocoris tenuis]|uniref:inositol-phosphate phosphatase n=1 Tax=Nesidiocoris tenuis TaxID=355587 RepID=A0A6H5FXZ5_9HEMI|nr:unnamed protein product [Nesidiocoris tenuis]